MNVLDELPNPAKFLIFFPAQSNSISFVLNLNCFFPHNKDHSLKLLISFISHMPFK